MKKIIVCMFCFLANFATAQSPLRVSENGRYLVEADGTPFYWLGDTGWALFHKLNRSEVEYYFSTRSHQGFSVIHAAVHHVNPFVLPPKTNQYGDLAFIDDDITKPLITPGSDPKDSRQYDFWDHVDFVLDAAAKYNLYINFLPIFNLAQDDGYNCINKENAFAYGEFLGERFGSRTNIIWCIGGDVLAETDKQKAIWNLLAKGINQGVAGNEDYSETLMTFHTRGGNTSWNYFADAPWLDFHMLQTWASFTEIYGVVLQDYKRTPVKPILHGEGAYEGGPEYPTKPITPFVIRKQVYWAMFAGGLHTYGNSNVWSFGTNPNYVSLDWKKAVNSEGAECLTLSRDFFESVEWWTFVPDQSVIAKGIGADDSLNVAMRSRDNDKVIVYCSHPSTIVLDLKKLESRKCSAVWVDPTSGEKSEKFVLKRNKAQEISTPDGWQDALLVVCENGN